MLGTTWRHGSRWGSLGAAVALWLWTMPGHAQAVSDDPFAFVGDLGTVLTAAERYYVEPLPRAKLLEGAVRGMIGKLDPHSAYLDAKEYRELLEETEGKFGGIGIEVDLRDETLLVIAPIEGGPAAKAGIVSGDRIVSVDGLSVGSVGLEKMMGRLRGEPGTQLTVVVQGPKSAEGIAPKPRVVQLTRAIIEVNSVLCKRLDDDVAYLRVRQFQEGTHAAFLKALASLRRQSPKPLAGVVLDLRSNPGGLVDEAVAIADEFLSDGVILTMRARGRETERIEARAGGALLGMPTTVLMNEWSASAAELLAGALQDAKVGYVVGAPSFGKGSVQSVMGLPGGAGLKLTIARYYTPAGHAVQADGIHPDLLAVAEPRAQDVPLPVLRERDLPGHLVGDGVRRAATAPIEQRYAGLPGDYAVARDTPADPRTGADGPLRLAYEWLLARRAPSAARQ